MAKAKRSKKGQSAREIRKKSKAVWDAATPEQWFEFAKQNDKRGQGSNLKLSNASIVTTCTHGRPDTNPSMSINPTKGYVKCFSCGYYEWNCTRAWADFTGKSTAETVKTLQSELGVKILSGPAVKELEAEFQHVLIKNTAAAIFNEELVEARNVWVDCGKNEEAFKKTEYYFAWDTLVWLEKRGLIDRIPLLPIGLFTTLKRLGDLAGSRLSGTNRVLTGHEVQMMKDYFLKYAKEYYLGGLVLVYHSTPNDVSTFRLRIPREGSKGIVSIEDPRENKLGVFGLGMYGHLTSKDHAEIIGNTTRVVVVEGEFDQMQYAVQAADAGNSDLIVLSHCGATDRDMSELATFGIKRIFYVPDHDTGGDLNTKEMLQINSEFEFRIFQWPQGLLDPKKPSTDIDESLQLYGFGAVHGELTDWDKNWIKPELWAKEQVKKKVAAANIDDNLGAITRVVFDFAMCIGDVKDENQAVKVNGWINQQLTEYGLSVTDAKQLANDFMAKDSAEAVLCSQINLKLRERFEFVAVDRKLKTIPLMAWDRTLHTQMEVNLSVDSHVKASFSATLGKLTDWVRSEISIPDFIKYKEFGSDVVLERSILEQEDMLCKFVVFEIKSIAHELPDLSSYEKYRSGVHWLHTTTGMQVFVVNGKHIYKCGFNEAGLPTWEELDTPVYEKYMFEVNSNPWSKVLSLEALQKPQRTTLRERLDLAQDMLHIGWDFQSQSTEPWGLASFIVMSPILKIFPQNLQFLAANERSTGKSTLYAELVGGGKNTDINLVEHSMFVDNATPAGIRQSMDGSSLIMVLDEFDNQSHSRFRSERIEEVLTIFRTCSAGEGKYLQGTMGGESKVYRLSFPVMVAGIDPAVNDANMTRFITTDLRSGKDHRVSPRTAILRKYTVRDIDTLRQQITLDAFHDIPRILQAYNEVKKRCHESPEIMGTSSMQRYKDNMCILAAGLHAAGIDWEAWAKATCVAKQKLLKSMAGRTANDSLFEALVFTSNIEATGIFTRKLSVADFIRNPNYEADRFDLNTSGSGAHMYGDEDSGRWYLMVVWQEALGGILRGTDYARSSTASLKSIADRHRFNLTDAQVDALKIQIPTIPVYTMHTPTSFFDVTEMVDEEAEKQRVAKEFFIARESAKASAEVAQ